MLLAEVIVGINRTTGANTMFSGLRFRNVADGLGISCKIKGRPKKDPKKNPIQNSVHIAAQLYS
jgi:hypothetical protein